MGDVTLKPCPFCGGVARWIDEHDRIGEPFGLVVEHAERCFIGGSMMADWDTIIAAWNTRARADAKPNTWPKADLEEWAQGFSRTPYTVLKAFIDAGFCSDQAPQREETRLIHLKDKNDE